MHYLLEYMTPAYYNAEVIMTDITRFESEACRSDQVATLRRPAV